MRSFFTQFIPIKIKVIISKYLIKKSPKYKSPLNQNDVLDCQIAYNKFGAYCIPNRSISRPAVQDILKGRVYEELTIAYMRDHCSNGDIIHAGTFFGDFLPGLSKGIQNDAKIWAFEPNPESYNCASVTVAINKLDNVILNNFGLGAISSSQYLLVKDSSGHHLGGKSKIVEAKIDIETVVTQIVAIDDLIPEERNVSIIQLDVEGYEKEAIVGALKTIARCKPILILEDNNKIVKSEWFKEKVLSMGYKFELKVHGNKVFRIINQ